MSNQQLDDLNQERADRELADLLGINYDELSELEYTHGTDESNEGMVYSNYVEFNPEVGKEILKKINLDSNNTFYYNAD
ncbi:hypothetical protein [Chryseobacterium indoltheticum]|uniref:Uncharacterized protein n=1 Tax=Chryseobacterium indoltheticum TaxID=254 RepID=A0A381FHH0_9FLAO|nr:hypothetical protein [Chryseobacterium indoltheticum]AZA74766.1 hypothetical protein EG358_13775 [Chryseobacterium indoltheticum]SIQ36054.1 hypothetical protein SAMN05421682_104213 [Chryseobacterium indoltheticum]SUX45990.1 Uncharacterised protein [Chryseobacterium indoltheticum]